MGDSRELLRAAVAGLEEVTAVSPVYETEPVGGPDQDRYLNVVVELSTRHDPRQLLAICRDLELAADRVRRVRWGPRTLDVDIIWMDGIEVSDPDLTIPHARAHERNFVMCPLLDLDPEFDMPGYDPAGAVGTVHRLGPL